MHQAARGAGLDPDRISFTRTLNAARRNVTSQAALSPSRLHQGQTRTTSELLERLLPPRRRRSNPRVIKRKMTNWHLKHPHHRNPPLPLPLPLPLAPTVTLTSPTKPTNRRPKTT
ncbi:hypothetical protein [Streptomyces sp. 900105245]